MTVEYVSFPDRSLRSRYIAGRFKAYLTGKVLDVGCDRAVLKTLIPSLDYTGIDIDGTPDLRLDLERVEKLPFPDRAFHCVVCSDVLEHLNNLHQIFDELVRVADRYLILSLPNNWCVARVPIERGWGSFGKYGLPVDPSGDRHKWFFSLAEAVAFIEHQTKRHPVSIAEYVVSEKPRPAITRALRRLRYPSNESYWNRYAHTLWIVLDKKASAP
jgi:2-polyprenyl-3-methyl-5-hydroxy-6-metoxy-1,4-benzoquinol methylase